MDPGAPGPRPWAPGRTGPPDRPPGPAPGPASWAPGDPRDPGVKDPEYRGPRGSRDEDLNGLGTRGESGTPKGADPEVADP